jgi:hypothetical protein
MFAQLQGSVRFFRLSLFKNPLLEIYCGGLENFIL